jgi:osmoprotectant transport system substrate-binding protein
MRKAFRNRAVGAVLALALVATACGSGDSTDGETITIGSFNFNESVIVAEIYAQALEEAGFDVERRFNLGSREIVKPALEGGEIDLVPEYIGTINSFLGGEPTADSDATFAEAKRLFEDQGVTLLAYAPAQSKNAYVVTAETASSLGLTKVSDLGPYASEMVFGGPPECDVRRFCLQGLVELYGLNFAEFRPLDVGGPITVAALEGNDIQVALLFSADGIIAEKGFVVLEDDMGLNPAENVAPAIRVELVEEHGSHLTDVLAAVSAALTQDALIDMNRRADVNGEDPADIAADFVGGLDI